MGAVRRIAEHLVQSRLELCHARRQSLDLREQHPVDGRRLRRLAGEKFLTKFVQRHAAGVAEIDCGAKTSSLHPGGEGLRTAPDSKYTSPNKQPRHCPADC